jgi:hypothetical protein
MSLTWDHSDTEEYQPTVEGVDTPDGHLTFAAPPPTGLVAALCGVAVCLLAGMVTVLVFLCLSALFGEWPACGAFLVLLAKAREGAR